MTETEWLEASDPNVLLVFLFGPLGKITDEVYFSRKGLLLVCAGFDRLAELLPPIAHRWKEHAALAAEGHYEKQNLHGEGEEADCEIGAAISRATIQGKGRLQALLDLWTWLDFPVWEQDESIVFWKEERMEQCTLVRDIFGNPFRPVSINPTWLTQNVVALTQTIYDDRTFDRLPALADALVEAGCDNEDILNHCHSDWPHVRGCWVVDMILGKE